MSRQETANFIIMLCVSLLMFGESAVVWRRFRFPGGPAMSLALFVGGAESLCYAVVFSLGHGSAMLHLAAIYAATGPALGAFWFASTVPAIRRR